MNQFLRYINYQLYLFHFNQCLVIIKDICIRLYNNLITIIMRNYHQELCEKTYLNKTFQNKYGENYTVIEYFTGMNLTVKFDKTLNSDIEIIKYKVSTKQIKDGIVLNKNSKSLISRSTNIGFVGIGKYNCTDNKKCFYLWSSILFRCYDKQEKHIKTLISYDGCSVDEKWHNFQNFAEWFYNNYVEGFELDKDIIKKRNKIYSEETCCFVPHEINMIFLKQKKSRGLYPIGVSKIQKKLKNKYISQTCNCGKVVYLGSFNSPEEAFNAYKLYKERYIKWMSLVWKSKISEKVFIALNNYTIEITD